MPGIWTLRCKRSDDPNPTSAGLANQTGGSGIEWDLDLVLGEHLSDE